MSSIDDAATALQNDRLFVHPELDSELTTQDQQQIRQRLEQASSPVFVVLLPSGDEGTAEDIANRVDRRGTYVTLPADGQGGVASNTVDVNAAREIAGQAFGGGGGVGAAQIGDFVSGIEQEAAGGGSGAPAGSSDGGGSGLVPLALLAAIGGGGFLIHRRNLRRKERTQLDQVRETLDEDITAYGEELTALDFDVRAAPADSATDSGSPADYARALDLYESAKTGVDKAERPAELQPVTESLEEGRWLLSRVRARAEGKPLPDRRPPCFFDPRHGPSTEDVTYAPPGGVAREVPACAADAIRIREGSDPDVRLVRDERGNRSPYWDAGEAYGYYAGGYYAGVLPAMFMGTMMGSMMGGSMAGMGGAGGFDGGGFDAGGGFDGGGFDVGGGGFDFGGFDF